MLDADLSPAQREALAAGHHDRVAAELLAAGKAVTAAAIFERIWNFAAAYEAYRQAGHKVDALRVALEDGAAPRIDAALSQLHAGATGDELAQAIALLERQRRPLDAARLRQCRADEPEVIAQDLLAAGDRLGAARVLADDGRSQAALEVLAPAGELPRPHGELALAAELAWALGDADQTARFAQRGLRIDADDEDLQALLARALVALGHELAAQMVYRGNLSDAPSTPVSGRYRVTGVAPSALVGASYIGLDRVTLQEVEIHLLLAEQGLQRAPDPDTGAALERFATTAQGAASLAHPAIRPILRLDTAAGLLVLPRPEGPSLRSLIRPPGMLATRARARAMLAFLAEGLAAAHARGYVHGWLLPSLITCDTLGRPQLGPFGAHHLSGLAATHTGSLDEIMLISAPELRRGQPPTVASDLYALGSLGQALLLGTIRPQLDREPQRNDAMIELSLAQRLTDPAPDRRPELGTVLSVLRQPLPDMAALGVRVNDGPETEAAPTSRRRQGELRGLVIEADASWPDPLLDRLCGESHPWWQPVLDRTGRRLTLATWPTGCKGLSEGVEWKAYVPSEVLAVDDPELDTAIRARVRHSSFVRTPSGHWMLALDDLLQR